MAPRSSSSPEPWYSGGLCFSCTQCGDCCRHDEGYVWVNQKEISAISAHLGLDEDEMRKRYVRRVGRRFSLIEKPNLDCIFWDNGCTIYPVRPRQCRTYPFWPEVVESPETWAEESACCPGVDQGRCFSVEEIEHLASGHGETLPEGDGASR